MEIGLGAAREMGTPYLLRAQTVEDLHVGGARWHIENVLASATRNSGECVFHVQLPIHAAVTPDRFVNRDRVPTAGGLPQRQPLRLRLRVEGRESTAVLEHPKLLFAVGRHGPTGQKRR